MQITQNLKLKQSQSLVMTPQLQQAIKLLQLNNLELSDLVNKELEENPFLENESNEENIEKFEEETNDLSESFESGESIADEPKIEILTKESSGNKGSWLFTLAGVILVIGLIAYSLTIK